MTNGEENPGGATPGDQQKILELQARWNEQLERTLDLYEAILQRDNRILPGRNNPQKDCRQRLRVSRFAECIQRRNHVLKPDFRGGEKLLRRAIQHLHRALQNHLK